MKTLIWDFNGTIIDDVDLCLNIENRMLAKRNLPNPVSLKDYKDMFCFPVIDYYYKVGYTFEDETYDEVSVEFNRMYDDEFDTCTLNKGFTEKIREAVGKGYRNVILSASRHDALIDQCRRLNIEQYFEEILGIDNMLAGSKIGMARRWMENSNVRPEDCKFIGDTIHDMETAEALNINDYVLIAAGHQSYDVLKKETDRVVHDLYEVVL